MPGSDTAPGLVQGNGAATMSAVTRDLVVGNSNPRHASPPGMQQNHYAIAFPPQLRPVSPPGSA